METLTLFFLFQVLADNSLFISTLGSHHSGQYNCSAQNTYGRDTAVWNVKVVSPPSQPSVSVHYTTESSVHLAWKVPDNGGLPITGIQSK